MKKLFALSLACLLTVACAAVFVTAEELSATVTVTVSKAGELMATAETVLVTDADKDGALTVSDALYAVHEACYTGGASAGYEAYLHKEYGLSLGKLWGDASGNFGYYVNNASAWSLADPVQDGDYVYAFVYADGKGYSDVYAFFDRTVVSGKAGEDITLTLSKAGYDADWNPVVLPVEGAVITVNGVPTEIKTDANGQATLTLTEEGEMLISATCPGVTMVPPVCKATVAVSVPAGDTGIGTFAILGALAFAGLWSVCFSHKKLDN